MIDPDPDPDPSEKKTPDRFEREVERKEKRRLKAKAEGERDVTFWLGMFGLVGWSVALPALLMTLLGVWLDGRFPGPVSWALTFLLTGMAIGCLNAWYWIQKESRDD